MRSFSTTAKVSGVAAATAALLGGGLYGATAASAEERPIEPAQAPQIMDTPWTEYAVGDSHANVYAVTNYLTAETDDAGEPYWPEDPTEDLTQPVSDALLDYQADRGLGEHGEIKEELWGHFSDGQFVTGAFGWGPANGAFYTIDDTGVGVESVQYLLIHHGYLDEGGDDGHYGPVTEAAVEDFQANEVCPEVDVSEQECVDGLAGEVTYRALVTVE
ncbi:peptidoglycan-binding domain-containing protein [Nocardiopsis salina]|uniref:peptidoglycan-binding domain-containing protein n=1 Tax=Nocardiopsis salina TaxID=245836 RepID=UPI00034CB87B|nr:peptidoglycan-binding domain-containing protein [Nocardiopsis salina]